MVPQVNAVLRGLLPDLVPLQTGYVAHHVANVGLLYRARALLDTWNAMTVRAPDGAEILPPWLPFSVMDPIVSSAPQSVGEGQVPAGRQRRGREAEQAEPGAHGRPRPLGLRPDGRGL